MKSVIAITVIMILSQSLKSQTNLIPNGNFDIRANSIPCQPNFCENDGWVYKKLTDYWSHVNHWGIPKRGSVNIDLNTAAVGTPDYFCDIGAPSTLPGSGHHRPTEYHVVKANSILSSGKYYYWEFWVQARNQDNSGVVNAPTDEFISNAKYGLSFHKKWPKQTSYSATLDYDAGSHYSAFYTYANKWRKLWGIAYLTFDCEYLSLGNYNGSGKQLVADAVSLYDIGEDRCTEQWLLEDVSYTTSNISFGGPLWQASNLIRAGFDTGNPNQNGNVIVNSGVTLTYKAGNEVNLRPGFSAKSGSDFHAYINNCGPIGSYKLMESNNYKNSISVCQPQEITTSLPEDNDFTYVWSPADNLNSTTKYNPIFTPPVGKGEITYTITVTDKSGVRSTEELTVKYANVDNNPSVVANIKEEDNYAPKFDITLGENTEKLVLQIWDWNEQNKISEEEFYIYDDIQCCEIKDAVPPQDLQDYFCDDLKIKLVANNFCSNIEATKTINWEKSSTLSIGNMPTIMNADIQCYSVPVKGGTKYDIEVYDSDNLLVYSSYGNNIFSNQECMWYGLDNNGNQLQEGYYYPTVWLKSTCSGVEETIEKTQNNGVNLLWGNNKSENHQITSLTNTEENVLKIYPNPSNGVFLVETNTTIDELIIEDVLGKRIWQNKNLSKGISTIKISEFSKGVYFLKVVRNDSVNTYKIIKK